MRKSIHLVAVAAIGTVALAACSPASDKAAESASSTTSSTTSTTTSADRAGDIMFAQMMIPHHQQAVQMSDMALSTTAGASAPVKKLATQIKKAQAPEIATMQGWLKGWGSSMPTGGMDHSSHMMSGMMSDQDMKSLQSLKGSAFDKKWLTMMIEHHKGAVQMAQNVLKTSKDAGVRKLATSIISSQNAEIKTMQGML